MSNRRKLSSELTFIYKIIYPIFFLIFIVLVNLTINKDESFSSILELNISLIVFLLISYLPIMNIKKVEYNNSKLIVSNYRKEIEYDLKDVKDIYSRLIFFYFIRIETKTNKKKVMYLAPARERSLNPFKTVESVREFKKKINL